MVTAGETYDEQEVMEYLHTLSSVQEELLELLVAKREAISAGDIEQLNELGDRELSVQRKMADLQVHREQILAIASEAGTVCESLEDLVTSGDRAESSSLVEDVREAKQRMRSLQHETLTNWVVEQTSLLHVSRMLEIIARGGRLQPTYSKSGNALNCGTLVDREV